MNIATGFDFQPLPDGNVLIEFYGDDGKTISTQVVTAEVVRRIPMVAVLTGIAVRHGPEVVEAIIGKVGLHPSKGNVCDQQQHQLEE